MRLVQIPGGDQRRLPDHPIIAPGRRAIREWASIDVDGGVSGRGNHVSRAYPHRGEGRMSPKKRPLWLQDDIKSGSLPWREKEDRMGESLTSDAQPPRPHTAPGDCKAPRALPYPKEGVGEIYERLAAGLPLNQCPAAKVVVGTPILLFLDVASLREAVCVCKLWWSELFTPEKLNFFFGLVEALPSSLRTPGGHGASRFRLSDFLTSPLSNCSSALTHANLQSETLFNLSVEESFESFDASASRRLERGCHILSQRGSCPPEGARRHVQGDSASLHEPTSLPPKVRNILVPRIVLNANTRPPIWRLILLGESGYSRLPPNTDGGDQRVRPLREVKTVWRSEDEFEAVANDESETTSEDREPAPGATAGELGFAARRQRLETRLDTLGEQTSTSIRELIRKDVERTFPQRSLFSRRLRLAIESPGKQSLFRILSRTALEMFRADLGYCQGMNFVAATFLQIFRGDEVLALRCFAAFLGNPAFGKMYEPSLSTARRACRRLDELISSYLPNLAERLQGDFRIDSITFGLQWVITFMAYDLPADQIGMLWDQLLLRGPSIICQAILGLLWQKEAELIGCSYEEALRILHDLVSNARLNLRLLADFASRFPVSSFGGSESDTLAPDNHPNALLPYGSESGSTRRLSSHNSLRPPALSSLNLPRGSGFPPGNIFGVCLEMQQHHT